MNDINREYAFVALAVLLAFTGSMALGFWFSDKFERPAIDFRAACESVNGKAVHNGRYWECLK